MALIRMWLLLCLGAAAAAAPECAPVEAGGQACALAAVTEAGADPDAEEEVAAMRVELLQVQRQLPLSDITIEEVAVRLAAEDIRPKLAEIGFSSKSNHSVADSCEQLGCMASYKKGLQCQCTASCHKYNNCCYDFASVCEQHDEAPTTCASLGCDAVFVKGRSCQCNSACVKYGSCCADFQQVCGDEPITTTVPPKEVPLNESCKTFGCGGNYKPKQACQCTTHCAKYNSCCKDYEPVCEKKKPPPPVRHINHTCPNVTCHGGTHTLRRGEACDPVCPEGSVALGQTVCRGYSAALFGPGCVTLAELPYAPPSDVDAVPDATLASDMVFKAFTLTDPTKCLTWSHLPEGVRTFIMSQAGKYGPSAAAIEGAKMLGQHQKTEFFLSIEQVSVLLAQMLCGATEVASSRAWRGAGDHPQVWAFGRAMEHWYQDGDKVRDPGWRRTTLVGYGTFDADRDLPGASSKIATTTDLTITSGCGQTRMADSGLGDSDTLTVVFAGHYVGGWMTGWHKENRYGAQEEKFGTLVPEMMLATEPLRHMGAGLLSNGKEDPWLPEAGWYILGAGTYIKGKGYPNWGSERVPISEHDYLDVGNGRRIRRRGVVAILAKPCNDRGGCESNTNDHQFKCYNQQVKDHDLAASDSEFKGADLWGIASGAYNFAYWPSNTRKMLEDAGAAKKWVLQAGGWGAGAFGCGTLYNGLLQALAAKKGGWANMRMCWAGRNNPYPTLASKFGFVTATVTNNATVVANKIENFTREEPLMTGTDIDSFEKGSIVFKDYNFGAAAEQLWTRIDQYIPPPQCASDGDAPTIRCNRPTNKNGDCISNMVWCCQHNSCPWHRNTTQDLRDFVAVSCNPDCSASKGLCTVEHIPEACRPHNGTDTTTPPPAPHSRRRRWWSREGP